MRGKSLSVVRNMASKEGAPDTIVGIWVSPLVTSEVSLLGRGTYVPDVTSKCGKYVLTGDLLPRRGDRVSGEARPKASIACRHDIF